MSLLEQRLASVEEHALAVIEAASQTIELPLQNELWWPDLIAQYGSETALFAAIGVDKALFEEVFSLVENVLDLRGGGAALFGRTGKSCYSC